MITVRNWMFDVSELDIQTGSFWTQWGKFLGTPHILVFECSIFSPWLISAREPLTKSLDKKRVLRGCSSCMTCATCILRHRLNPILNQFEWLARNGFLEPPSQLEVYPWKVEFQLRSDHYYMPTASCNPTWPIRITPAALPSTTFHLNNPGHLHFPWRCLPCVLSKKSVPGSCVAATRWREPTYPTYPL